MRSILSSQLRQGFWPAALSAAAAAALAGLAAAASVAAAPVVSPGASASVTASPAAAPGARDDAVRQRIRDAVRRATGLTPEAVQPSALLPGFYEVRAKESVAYVDAAGKLLISGPVIDLATGENLSLRALPGAAASIDVNLLPLADAIHTVSGKGERRLFVFVDPNCSYCRSLEPELGQLTNTTVYRFVMPALGAGSKAAAQRVWCAADKAAAWRQTVAGQAPVAATADAATPRCDAAALDRNLALAKRLGVAATPTLVFANGERVAAMMRAPDIEARLAGRAALDHALNASSPPTTATTP